jgi:hypothetical protein
LLFAERAPPACNDTYIVAPYCSVPGKYREPTQYAVLFGKLTQGIGTAPVFFSSVGKYVFPYGGMTDTLSSMGFAGGILYGKPSISHDLKEMF